MIALIWTLITTVVSVAVGYTIFLIAQKIVHFFGRASGVAAYKLHEKLQKPETKEAIRKKWDKTKTAVSDTADSIAKKFNS